MVDEGDVVCDLAPEVEQRVPRDGGPELQRPLVVEEGGGEQGQLVHTPTKVVVNLLTQIKIIRIKNIENKVV